MGKLRAPSSENKISKKSGTDRGCCSKQCPWFSFNSVTHNSNYNLGKLKPGKEREETYAGLLKRLTELSGQTWTYWTQQPRSTGLETINYGEINFKADPSVTLANDCSIYVFRFDTHLGLRQGRILGYKQTPCATLHIIGYDLDFSAYNHG